MSNHNSPFSGAAGAPVEAAFSSNLTRFSFSASPKLEKLFPKSVKLVLLSEVPSWIVAIVVPSVLFIVYGICLYLLSSSHNINCAYIS